MNKAFNKVIKSHIGLTVLTVLAVVLLTGSVTYSLFQTESRNSKNQTIAIGTLSTDMTSSSGAIILDDMYPEDASDITDEDKKYTFTISNTGTYTVKYKIYLKDATDTFLANNTNYASYTKLSSDYYQYINYKLDGGSANNLQSIYQNDKFLLLEGTLAPSASENHYIQFFIDNGDTTSSGAPNDMTGSILSLDITMDANASGTIVDDIIASANEGTPDFTKVATTDEGVYATEDNYGTSYYFRGAVENNYVRFAGFYWRIIRVNGDGTLRLIYDGTTAHENGEDNSDRVAILNVPWNLDYYNDAKYVGYMYGGTNGTESKNKAEAQTNNTDSNVKTILEQWYIDNISIPGYDNNGEVADVLFCNDRTTNTVIQEWWSSDTTLGYATETTAFGGFSRLRDTTGNTYNSNPSLICAENNTIKHNNDWFTVNETTLNKGNGKLSVPVGLITGDEIQFAGGLYANNNEAYYLYKGKWYWSMTPSDASPASLFIVASKGFIANNDTNYVGNIAPVINLSAEYVSKMIGTGTMSDPYRVE